MTESDLPQRAQLLLVTNTAIVNRPRFSVAGVTSGDACKMSPPDASVTAPVTNPHIASALRTLDTEREGVAALAAAMCDGLGAPFVAAVETIRGARGRVIVTGMGKSGHVGRKIAATLARPARPHSSCTPPTPATATSA